MNLRPPRLSDVARAAGVSAQTVSNVLHDRPGFAETTRARVLAAAADLGYSPDRAARQLRTRRSQQLGLHLPVTHLSPQNHFTISFLRTVVEATEQVDHQLVVFTHPLGENVSQAGRSTFGVDGFVLYNIDPVDERPGILARAGIPFAVFGRMDPTLPQAWVDIDNARAMWQLADHLLARGYRTFGYAGYAEPEYWNHERLAGAQDRLALDRIAIPQRWLVMGALDTIAGQIADRLLGEDRPEVIICASDSLAEIAHRLTLQRGLKPGSDIGITGFDMLPGRVEQDPPITSVVLPIAAAAQVLVQLVISQADGDPAPAAGTVLPTHVAGGGSTW